MKKNIASTFNASEKARGDKISTRDSARSVTMKENDHAKFNIKANTGDHRRAQAICTSL